MSKVYEVAIIGAGPAGIAGAVEAVLLGMKNIILFEKAENHSTTIRKFYKDNKRVDVNWKGVEVKLEGNVKFFDGSKEDTLNHFDRILDDHRIEPRFNTEIEKIKKNGEYFDVYPSGGEPILAKNVIIAIGNMGKPNKPSYPIPKSLDHLIKHNLDGCTQNEKILVVGGGDSAVEYAYFLCDLNDVTLTYRKNDFTRINDTNRILLDYNVAEDKIRLKLGVDITNIENEDGKIKVNFNNGKSEIYNRMVLAIGGTMPTEFLKKCGVGINEKGLPQVDTNLESSTRGLYVAGDIIADSGGSIAVGLNHGYKIINHIKSRSSL